MKVVLIGGHLAPALSVIEALPESTKILFMGRKYALEGDKSLSLEYRTITRLNIPFVEINTGRLQRKVSRHTIPSFFKLPFAIFRSFLTLIKFKPDVVVGFGGYVSVPVVACAYLLRIPVVIHEQTLEAGLANRILAGIATKICISWQSSVKYFPKEKTVFTGNPIRQMANGKCPPAGEAGQMVNKERLPIIYITGGSSGSHFINLIISEIIKELLEKYVVIHQTGDARQFRDFERLEKLKNSFSAKLSSRYILKKFIDPSEVGSLLTIADLVVSRGGMSTVTEIIYFKKPALLIPLPFSQNNEQLKNAKFLADAGLGEIREQKKLDSKKLLQTIDLMFQNIDNYKIKDNELRNRLSQAGQNIISVINYVAKAKKTKVF